MIGRLRGILLEKQAPYLLLDVSGVAYELQAPMTTFYRLPALGQEVILHTHLSITENLHQLFGFFEQRDRSLFRTLIKVNGVGPKLAVAILSGMEADDIARCVRDNNIKALTKVPGIGQKTAERLVIELRDRLKNWDAPQGDADAHNQIQLAASNDHYTEAESALISLGYKPNEAAKMVAAAAKQKPEAKSEEIIRLALKAQAN
jgi:holliday junction DNA helicase RuvA